LQELGETLQWPKAVSRNLGVDVARGLRSGDISSVILRTQLMDAKGPEHQTEIMQEAVALGQGADIPKKSRQRWVSVGLSLRLISHQSTEMIWRLRSRHSTML